MWCPIFQKENIPSEYTCYNTSCVFYVPEPHCKCSFILLREGMGFLRKQIDSILELFNKLLNYVESKNE